MSQRTEPLAVELLRRHRRGESLEQLAAELTVPIDRIRQRISAAAACWKQLEQLGASPECQAGLAALSKRLGAPT
jgi:DNA-directed RNA polymerase specialized sigma24 family protein